MPPEPTAHQMAGQGARHRGTPESSDGERSRNAQALPAQVGRARPQDAR